MKLGLRSKTKILIIYLYSDEINVKSINPCCAQRKRIYAADVLSIRHHLSFLDTFIIVSDAPNRLTEQHGRKEGTTNIYWRPTKCQVHQIHLGDLEELSFIPFSPQCIKIVGPPYMFDKWMKSKQINAYRRTKLKSWKLRVENEWVIPWRYIWALEN